MISCQSIYNDLVAAFSTGTGNLKLNDAFPRAVNRALDQLSVVCDLPTKFPHITAISDTVDAMDDHFEYVLYSGTMFWMIRMGYKPGDAKTATLVYNDTREMWEEGQADYKQDRDNKSQEAGNQGWGIRKSRKSGCHGRP